ncbi:hypothetical protein BGZ65_004191, partial [Modicella reniformis]
MGNNPQVALEKFARYVDVDCRLVPVSEESHHCLDPKKAAEACGENTIGVYVILASGGFVAPFAFPKLRWSFELPRVKSINASGHKYGLAYPGIGWVLWRSEEYLPKELVFTLTYLGAEEQTYTLNFSRPACFVIAQYYNFVRLGKEGYTSIIQNDIDNARL